MVSLTQLLKQRSAEISQSEQQLQKQSAQVQAARTKLQRQEQEFVQRTKVRPVTVQRQIRLAQQVGSGAVPGAVKQIRKQKVAARKETLPKFRKAETQIETARGEIQSKQKQVAKVKKEVEKLQAFERGRKLAGTGTAGVFALQTREERKGFRAGVEEIKDAKARAQQIEAFSEAGLKPVLQKGKIVGFEDVQRQISIETKQLGDIGKERLAPLTAAGIVTVEEVAPVTLPPIVSQVVKEPTFKEKFVETFRGTTGLPGFDPLSKIIIERVRGEEKLVGIGAPPPVAKGFEKLTGIKTSITLAEVETRLRGVQGPGRIPALIVSKFIPTTPEEVGLTALGVKLLTAAPPIISTVAGAGFGVLEARTALDPTLPKEERIAAGAIGSVALLGAGLQVTPFLKGLVTLKGTITGRFKGLEFEKITVPSTKEKVFFRRGATIKELLGEDISLFKGVSRGGLDIALIPPGSPFGLARGKGLPAFIRGGFGFTKAEQQAFVTGRPGTVVTSQIGFVERGLEVPKIERLFFGTPADPLTGIAQTRVSRLGLTDLFKVPKDTQIGFSPTKPQILVFEDVAVTQTGARGFKGLGLPSSELEVITTKQIAIGERVGARRIKGQRVDIFRAFLEERTGAPPSLETQLGKIKGFDISSFEGRQTIPAPIFATAPIATTKIISPKVSTSTLPTTNGTGLVQREIRPDFFFPTKPTRERDRPSLPIPTITKLGLPSLPTLSRDPPSPPIVPITPFTPPSVDFDLPTPRGPPRRKRKAERKPTKKKEKARRRFRARVKPSFTAIVTEFEPRPFITKEFGVSPGTLRGLQTGKPRIKVTKKKVKKPTNKKKSRGTFGFGFTDF